MSAKSWVSLIAFRTGFPAMRLINRIYEKPEVPRLGRGFATKASRARRLEKLGIGPDGKPLPIPNPKKIFPRMYPCLVVNQDGSTYTIFHHYPCRIITLPLDPSTLTEEEREAREKKRRRAKEYRYSSEEDHLDDEWDHSQYEDLLR